MRYNISSCELGVDCADSVCPKTMHGKEFLEWFLLVYLAVGYIYQKKRKVDGTSIVREGFFMLRSRSH